jgi:hypothetical protein
MMPTRAAAPTSKGIEPDDKPSEGKHDPHGLAWTRGAPPIDAHLFGNTTGAVDLVGFSATRHSDDKGDGTGHGRRASGFRAVDAGTLTFKTGAGQSETWALQPGEGDTIEMVELTSWTGTGLRVYW